MVSGSYTESHSISDLLCPVTHIRDNLLTYWASAHLPLACTLIPASSFRVSLGPSENLAIAFPFRRHAQTLTRLFESQRRLAQPRLPARGVVVGREAEGIDAPQNIATRGVYGCMVVVR